MYMSMLVAGGPGKPAGNERVRGRSPTSRVLDGPRDMRQTESLV